MDQLAYSAITCVWPIKIGLFNGEFLGLKKKARKSKEKEQKASQKRQRKDRKERRERREKDKLTLILTNDETDTQKPIHRLQKCRARQIHTAIQDGVSASAVPRPLPVPEEDRPGYAASALLHHQAEFERCRRHYHQSSGSCQALPCHGQGSRGPERSHCPEKWRGKGVWYLSSLGWRCWPRQGEPAAGPWQNPLPGVKEGIAYYCFPGGRCRPADPWKGQRYVFLPTCWGL